MLVCTVSLHRNLSLWRVIPNASRISKADSMNKEKNIKVIKFITFYKFLITAQAVVTCIYLAKRRYAKDDIRSEINEKYYNINFTLDEIRSTYHFDVTCQGSVPQAIVAFLEGTSFEDTIRNAISIGGDSDTIACIAGAIAECYFGVPEDIKNKALSYLDDDLSRIYQEWLDFISV